MLSVKLLVLLASLAPMVAPSPLAVVGQTRVAAPIAADLTGSDVADLKDQLEAGLRVRRTKEFAFIARVIEHVEQKRLSRQLVAETFQWAREKKPFPYPYFERAMTIRAAKVGVNL